jgi:hypothetical protein
MRLLRDVDGTLIGAEVVMAPLEASLDAVKRHQGVDAVGTVESGIEPIEGQTLQEAELPSELEGLSGAELADALERYDVVDEGGDVRIVQRLS